MGMMKSLASSEAEALGMDLSEYIQLLNDAPQFAFTPRAPYTPTIRTMKRLDSRPKTFLAWCEAHTRFTPANRYYAEWIDPINGALCTLARYRVGEWLVSFTTTAGEITEWGYSHITAD